MVVGPGITLSDNDDDSKRDWDQEELKVEHPKRFLPVCLDVFMIDLRRTTVATTTKRSDDDVYHGQDSLHLAWERATLRLCLVERMIFEFSLAMDDEDYAVA